MFTSLALLVLGHHYLLLELNANRSRYEAMLANGVDPQEIEDDFEARMAGVLARGGLAADEKSDSDASDSDE